MRGYLTKMEEAIHKRWLKHMPAEARSGEEGLALLQFKVDSDGTVPEDGLVFRIVFANNSLMEKALSAVRDASPFPPIPPDFREPFLKRQIIFLYNLPRQPPGCQ